MGDCLRSFADIRRKLRLPAPLRPYQWAGVNFLIHNKSALLADEMGLGKTVQTVVAVQILLQARRCDRVLVLAPESLRRNWEFEFNRWAPDVACRLVEGDQKSRYALYLLPVAVVVGSYDHVRMDVGALGSETIFDLVIADEAQRLKNPRSATRIGQDALSSTLHDLRKLRERYMELLREQVIFELRRLTPREFEIFAKELLKVYGFEELNVTRTSKDGGLDGYGKLKVGLSHLNVAFQCKRWTNGNIQRPEIDAFRGVAQGEFEQAIFFATTSFSQGAIDASIKRGAVPVVLIDVDTIFTLMVEKRFGIDGENFNILSYNLDRALTREENSREATAEGTDANSGE